MAAVGEATGENVRAQFEAELLRLRRGGGVHATTLLERLGPLLRELLQCAGTSADELRPALADLLLHAAGPLPTRRRQLVVLAYAAEPELGSSTLTERLRHAAEQMDRHLRTVQRRVDELSTLMAANLAARLDDLRGRSGFVQPGWSVERLSAKLSFVDPRPVLIERRQIQVWEETLPHLQTSVSLLGTEPAPQARVEVTAVEGCTVELVQRTSSRFWTVRLGLPHRLRYGARHVYEVALTLPERDNVGPLYGFAPLRNSRSFAAQVQFANPDDVDGVWAFSGVPQTVLPELDADGPRLTLDEHKTVSCHYEHLVQGLCYGVKWAWRRQPAP
jgi:hypothetical protein